MTNISNLNLTKGTIPPLLKYKIVFLGDQAVGKSSIINRFIYDIFDGNDHVRLNSCRDPQLASISFPRTFSYKKKLFASNSGILQGNKGFEHWFPIIYEILQSQSLFMMFLIEFLSIAFKSGLMMSSIKGDKGS